MPARFPEFELLLRRSQPEANLTHQPWDDMELTTSAGPPLPPEMWAHIFSFFSPRDVGGLALVCSAWRSASENDELWRPFFMGFAASGGPERAAWLDLSCRRRAAAHGDQLGANLLTKGLWGELAPVEGNWAGGRCDVTVAGTPRGRPVECMVIDEAHGRLIFGFVALDGEEDEEEEIVMVVCYGGVQYQGRIDGTAGPASQQGACERRGRGR